VGGVLWAIWPGHGGHLLETDFVSILAKKHFFRPVFENKIKKWKMTDNGRQWKMTFE
jgi:hypothetical protein